MDKWWKAPVLQGPENDYGDYDYLIEELPDDYVKWELSKCACKCDSCGKERRLLLRSVHHFHTLDGYDYMDYNECWKCRLKGKIWSIKRRTIKRIKNEIDIIRCAWMLTQKSSAGSFKYYYGILKKIRKA